MNISEVRKVVGKLRATLFKKANSHSIGMLKTNIRGTGLQFKEHQVYNVGDDIRFIDWKILAKTAEPYVKTFNEERNVEIVVLIDASMTMLTGYRGVSKLQAAIEICCLLYLLAEETSDFVHAIIVTDEVINLPKLSGEKGITQLISTLEKNQILDDDGQVNLDRLEKDSEERKNRYLMIMKHLSRKREIIILSDFNDFIEAEVLKKLMARANVHCFQLLSPLDEAKKIPYALFAKNSNSGRSTLGKYDLSGTRDLDGEFKKKIKKIKVQEKYLENFVKEMR